MDASPTRAEPAPTVPEEQTDVALAPTLPEEQTDVARVTYLYLRWLMVLLPFLLLVVTLCTAVQQMELERSISAYYGGPVRDVFVGVMIGTAACMVAYRGTFLLEDYTLNGAGLYAAFVAFVPSDLDEILSVPRENSTPDGVTPADYVWFLRTALTAVLVLFVFLLWIELKKSKRLTRLWTSGRWNTFFVVVTTGLLFLFLVWAMGQLWWPDPEDVTLHGISLESWTLSIHDMAAILLIAALAVAVFTHGWPVPVAKAEGADIPPTFPKIQTAYRVIFFLMLAGPFVSLGFYKFVSPEHTVIFLEWWEIVLFCVFWVLETQRVRKVNLLLAAPAAGRVGSAAPK